MRRKASIRKRADGWHVKVPGYGFSLDRLHVADDFEAARTEFINATGGRVNATSGGQLQRSYWRHDAIGPIPAWEPFYFRY